MAEREKGGSVWNTDDELRFLSLLGTWAEDQRIPRETLLQRYRGAMHLRSAWGAVDEACVRRRLVELLFTTGTEEEQACS